MRFSRILLGLLALSFAFAASGCGMAKSYEDRQQIWAKTWDTDARMLVDDIDTALLMDRPSRLSRYHLK